MTPRLFLLLALAAALPSAYSQTGSPNYVITYNFSDGNLRSVVDGTGITFPLIDINATSTAVMTVGNTGAAPGVFNSIVVTGDGFQVVGLPLMPAVAQAGQGIRFGITFTPSKSGTYRGSFSIDVGGRVISGSLAGSTAPPNLSLSYIDPRTNNVVALPNGSTLPFPDTPAGATSTVTLQTPNTGVGTGQINSIVLGDNAGGAFELLNLPVLPVSVPPSTQLRFAIRFSSPEPQTVATTLSLNLNGQTVAVNISAKATGPQYKYTYGPDVTISAGGTLVVPDTAMGQTSSVTVTILNGGNGNGQINSISASGQGFSVTDLPLFPLTLRPNQTQQFTLNFNPTQPGAITGRLAVGGEQLLLTGKSVGPRLSYAYTSPSAPTSVSENGTVFLPPTSVGATQMAQFSIQNDGTGAATLSSINASSPGGTFVLQDVPELPLSLEPGGAITFSVVFTPATTGALTGVLRINTTGFSLSGTGMQPAALPAYRLTTSTTTPQPAEQATVGLTLSSAYPLAVQGTLTLSFLSDVFTDDPAIQFASGGRTVKFIIPANSTQALFNTVSSTIPLQTGTTAGTIVLTPIFSLQGGYDLTPPAPATMTLTIPRSAPRLLSGVITNQTINTFSVALTGYSTTRSLKQLEIQVAAKAGENVATSRLTLDVTSAAAAWFQGATSQEAGGGFQLSIPFALQNGNATDDLVRRLQSLTITASNETGASAPLVIAIQ
jgi:hypothetical protein